MEKEKKKQTAISHKEWASRSDFKSYKENRLAQMNACVYSIQENRVNYVARMVRLDQGIR